ncbi:Y-family DNA polymerase [Dokdonia sp.]|uniref:Y-family DNA polymerase n=1 Tax=Dokdonia sp. TaxID=2024995 RepID=UPI003263CADC
MGSDYLYYTLRPMIAMVDCNSFYASCEQIFRPDLWGRPVVVLSNNDGCIIAANKEAKALTHIPMFEAVYKIKHILIKNKVTFFSSNYTMYGEMSQRVMNILGTFSPCVEVYSIDEAFLDVHGFSHIDIQAYGFDIKERIYQYTGLPVGVGIAPTKVLAKLANRMAKKIPIYDHVYVMDTEEKRIEALQWADIGDIWGIGRKHVKRLQAIGVFKAIDFVNLPLAWVRKEMTIVGERLWKELRGESCLEFMTVPNPKKAIGTAKSFGQKLPDLGRIEEACAYYITEVAEVLRAQKSCATYVHVALYTNYHSTIDKQYSNRMTVTMPIPTNDTFALIAHARKALHGIYKSGYRYKKVAVNLTGLIPQEHVQGNLFEQQSKITDAKIMKIVDTLNMKFGKTTVSSAMIGTRIHEWELIKRERSPRYTTQWRELLEIG